MIVSIPLKTGEYDKYSSSFLAALNLKSLVSAFDRLEKGYWSDSEAILKKAIEAFLALVYLKQNPQNAKKWLFGNYKLQKLNNNRKQLAQMLDDINKQKKFFPTDKEDFFEDYIYKTFYGEACNVAHMDFDYIYPEIANPNTSSELSNEFTLGPKFIESSMKKSMERILMFSLFQLSYLGVVSDYISKKEHQEIINKVVVDYIKNNLSINKT